MLFKLLLYWSILNTMWLFIRIRMISHIENHDPINQAKIRMPSIRSPRGDYCFPLKLVRRKNKLLLKASKSRRCEKTPSSSPLCGTTQTRHWFFTSFNSLQRGCDSDIYIGIHGGGEIPAGRRIHKVKSFLSPSSSPYWSSTIPSTLFLSLVSHEESESSVALSTDDPCTRRPHTFFIYNFALIYATTSAKASHAAKWGKKVPLGWAWNGTQIKSHPAGARRRGTLPLRPTSLPATPSAPSYATLPSITLPHSAVSYPSSTFTVADLPRQTTSEPTVPNATALDKRGRGSGKMPFLPFRSL